jgi:hypothetical protein
LLITPHVIACEINPILHTAWLDNHALTLKWNTAKYHFGEKSSFLYFFIKVWWHDATLFVCFILILNRSNIQSITFIHIPIRCNSRGSSPSLHCWSAQWEKPLWGAEPRIKLGPALQEANAY